MTYLWQDARIGSVDVTVVYLMQHRYTTLMLLLMFRVHPASLQFHLELF
jgi:hypothetical protein